MISAFSLYAHSILTYIMYALSDLLFYISSIYCIVVKHRINIRYTYCTELPPGVYSKVS